MIKLTKEQLKQIKSGNVNNEIFPDGSVKVKEYKKYKVLILDISKLYYNIISQDDILNIIFEYENIGWNFMFQVKQYFYFKKKNKKIFNIF